MTCRECREKWSALLDSELTSSEIKAVWEHIRECPDCCKYCCELTCLDAMVKALECACRFGDALAALVRKIARFKDKAIATGKVDNSAANPFANGTNVKFA
jgi:predicted anti-sigma-YlaC factor YlaD